MASKKLSKKYVEYLESEHWLKIRQLHSPPGSTCVACGANSKISLHHITYRFNQERTGDLLRMCSECHIRLHEELDLRYPYISITGQKSVKTCEVFEDVFGVPWAVAERSHVDGMSQNATSAPAKKRKYRRSSGKKCGKTSKTKSKAKRSRQRAKRLERQRNYNSINSSGFQQPRKSQLPDGVTGSRRRQKFKGRRDLFKTCPCPRSPVTLRPSSPLSARLSAIKRSDLGQQA